MSNQSTAQPISQFENDKEFLDYANSRVFDENGYCVKSDLHLRNKLAEKNMKLVPFVIDKIYGNIPGLSIVRNDLIQEGYIGLIESLPKFEPDMGYRFSTYAVYWIKQQIIKFAASNKDTPNTPPHVRTIYNKLLKNAKLINVSLKDLVENEEAAKCLGISSKMLENVKASMFLSHSVSLNEPVGSDPDGPTLQDFIKDEKDTVESNMSKQDLIKAVKNSLLKLTPRERNILLLRYGITEEVK